MLSVAQNPFKTPEFKALFREWNQKLRDDGFVDAEDFSLPDPALKSWHSLKWENESAQKREHEAKTYYALATELLHNGFAFKNDLFRRTWELHCQGMSERKIARVLRWQLIGYKGRGKTNIHDVIRAIQKAAGIKSA